MPTVTFGDRPGSDHSGCEESEMQQTAATTNLGANTTMLISTFGASDRRFGVMKFTGFSNITPPVTVTAVELRVFINSAGSAGPRNAQLKRCLRNWVESEVTWNVYSTGNSWTSGGGLSDGNDRSSTVSSSVALSNATGNLIFPTSADMCADVEGWINGTLSNFGWHMGLDNETGGDGKFWQWRTTETGAGSPAGDDRPQLTVTYTEGGGGGGTALMGQICY